jgi:hypothetical protein
LNTPANSLNYHLETILNILINRNTNANAAAFNSKIKRFSANQRGVVALNFFALEWRNFLANLRKIQLTPLNASFIDEPPLLRLLHLSCTKMHQNYSLKTNWVDFVERKKG